MRFTNSEPSINARDIANVEAILGVSFPSPVCNLYFSTNGGNPEPHVFEDAHVDTVVTEFLPLKSGRKGTALKSYERLVLDKKLVPQQFFPFAIDGGGDYFFVDCSTVEGAVYFYRSDSIDSNHLPNLKLGFEQFWASLKGEDS
ncbi:MAG TPA: SMI1/KNR4 family protein [Verrucomicrobiae bacterium]|nr:SMI1/KNR4 family protein [Verrucomicrobiae bacterium]